MGPNNFSRASAAPGGEANFYFLFEGNKKLKDSELNLLRESSLRSKNNTQEFIPYPFYAKNFGHKNNFSRASAAPGGDAINDFIVPKTVVLGVAISL